ncbi:MAG: HAMP domain-containing histidine kinase, partial [Pedobacter sp.]
MKKRGFWFITGLMSLALLGVVVMQLYYIKQAYNLNSQLFEQNVNQVLSNVVNKIQANNAFSHYNDKNHEWRSQRQKGREQQIRTIAQLKEKQLKENAIRRVVQQKRIVDDLNFQDSVIRAEYRNPSIIPEDKFVALGNELTTPLNLNVEFNLDADLNMVSGKIRNSFKPEVGKTFTMRPNSLPDTIRYIAYSRVDGQPLKISLASVDGALEAKFRSEDAIAARRHEQELKQLEADTVSSFSSQDLRLVEAAAKEVANVKEPLSRRISKDKLDTLIKKELLNKNITLNYDFWVKEANRDTLLYRKASNMTGDVLPSNTYKTTIFNRDVRRDPGMLYLSFPNQQSAIYGNMSATLASSGILLLVLIVIFSYTLYTILRQKKISEMKTDFINNMTHEFKTPVATIMIASEALKDPEIVEDKIRIKRLAGIIYDENVRLGNHIERVLSIARLEKRELHMESNEVQINELISAVMDSMNLQLQKRDAIVQLELLANPDVVLGDELHLSNVIYNLIDNANKYSVDKPHITVKTRNTNKSLIVEVADEGIGMTKEQSKR